MLRAFILVITAAALILLIRDAARMGYSRVLSSKAAESNQLDSADEALKLTPSDPEAHLARGMILWRFGRYDEAYREYEQGAGLRPSDFYPWLRLGYAHYLAEDQQGAVEAFRQAVRHAPYYADPHWMLGNSLLGVGRRDEAFDEFRKAAESQPALTSALIAQAWEAYGDASLVERVVRPRSDTEKLSLALFLAAHGQAGESLKTYRGISQLSQQERDALVSALIAGQGFAEAYEVWSGGKGAGASPGEIMDGDFEGPVALNNTGFGWRPRGGGDGLQLRVDPNEPFTGARSLRIDFSGDAAPEIPALSQLVIVRPDTQYRLSFAARTADLASLSLPLVIITDAANDKKVLGESAPVAAGTNGWQSYNVDFKTDKTTNAVVVSVRRQNCTAGPCQAYGHLWLDGFSLVGR